MDPSKEFGLGGLNRFVEAASLTGEIGLDDEEIAWRKQFVGFDAADERRLDDLEPLLRANQDAIADAFYDNLTGHEQTRAVIERSPKGVEQLKRTQKAYLVSLATGDYGEDYFTNRARIGKLHELLDMPLKQYVGQYGLYYDLILSRVDERVQTQVVDAIEDWVDAREATDGGIERVVGALRGLGGDDEPDGLDETLEATVRDAIHDGMQDVLAVLRILNLDLQVASDTYVDSYSQRLERAIDAQRELAMEVEEAVQPPVVQLQRSSASVAESAATIRDHAEGQAADATDAAADVAEVSAAAEEVASVAGDVRETSERAAAEAGEGVDAGERALDALESVEDTTEALLDTAERVEARAADIESVVDRVEDVVDRTAVLATNAKVEATRASDGGPTATIASELETFVEGTRDDLRELDDAATAVRAEAETTREAVADANERVHEGRSEVAAAVETLDEMEDVVDDAAAGMDEVAAAADQQARSVVELSETVEALAGAADSVASEAQSVASASEEQAASARHVADAVAQLSTDPIDEQVPVYERV
ncbi:globin-coupled sensor protein [Haloarchaeobius litoreus]|uniref:Protoglobin domain-containing protein n=1 Tax=Haloarchaeobius litoreus TaxID=755306 RepID=A0ABD6DD05_9EURY|nr:globin-coupled sensor protein [Haloarchaeobius litoreus]